MDGRVQLLRTQASEVVNEAQHSVQRSKEASRSLVETAIQISLSTSELRVDDLRWRLLQTREMELKEACRLAGIVTQSIELSS